MTAARPAFSVLIPTLNEAANIDALLTRLMALPAIADEGEILVVDDGSTDGTRELVLGWAGRGPVRLIERSGRPDLTLSILEGVAAARGDPVLVMDADLSHPPEQIPELLEPVLAGQADLAIGSRYVAGGAVGEWPWRRLLLSRLGSWVAWPVCDVRDPMSGFFAVRKRLLGRLGPAAAGYKILFELLMTGTEPERIREVPIRFVDRIEGASKLGLAQQLTYLRRLAALAGASPEVGGAGRSLLLAVALDWAVLVLLTAATGISPTVASLAAIAAMTMVLALANPRWFVRAGRIEALRALRYMVATALAAGLRSGVLASLLGLGAPLPAAALAASAAALLVIGLGIAFFVLPRTGPAPRALRWRMAAIAVMAYSAALRLAYLGVVPLLPGERAPVLGLRLASWLLWLPTAAAIGILAGLLHGKSVGLRAAMLAAILPWFFFAGFLATGDGLLVALYALLFASASLAVLRPSRIAAFIAGASALLATLVEPRALAAAIGPLLGLGIGRALAPSVRLDPAEMIVLGGLIGPAMLALLLGSDWAALIWSGAVLAPVIPGLALAMDPPAEASAAWRRASAGWPALVILLMLILAACLHEIAFGIPPLTLFLFARGASA